MLISSELRQRVEVCFSHLNTVSAAKAFPCRAALSEELKSLIGNKSATFSHNASERHLTLFATSAVEMWMRSIHSFLISASLTKSSPIWSSVSGYYSSHYAVRGLAHLLGYFQLYRKKFVAHLSIDGGRKKILFERKATEDREHVFYWRKILGEQIFSQDSFFTENNTHDSESDVGHRDMANYLDLLMINPNFEVLDLDDLKARSQQISRLPISAAPPIPRKTNFPDLESVQIMAYYRFVKFRNILNEILGDKNRFWKIYRTPTWINRVIDFQLNVEDSLRIFSE